MKKLFNTIKAKKPMNRITSRIRIRLSALKKDFFTVTVVKYGFMFSN